MEIFETFLRGLSLWTLLEGAWVLFFPKTSIRLSLKLFPNWGRFLNEIEPAELKKLAAIELAFGLILGVYLYFMAG
ncbi:hypothetical protein P0Y35_00905 [Kiritimatiellaeota bacterium B1221]|nr:hypothetical protein [Kiritimatiellaeota bacterium B1221]